MSVILTSEQKDIIYCTARFIEVKAGAGTGKTFTLLQKIKHLQESVALLSTEKILFFTYTNALTSNNLQSLSKDKKIDASKVLTSTLDSFLIQLLCRLNIPKDHKEILQNFEQENESYTKSREVALELFSTHLLEIKTRINILTKRFPYIFIDEIQDIKNRENLDNFGQQCDSPKYIFLNLLQQSPSLKQMIIVGDDKQSINGVNSAYRFSFDTDKCRCLHLTYSHRKEEFTGIDISETIERVLNSNNTSHVSFNTALIRLQDDKQRPESTLILIANLSRLDSRHLKALKQLPAFWYGGQNEGQKTLPQAFINSLFWYQKIYSKENFQSLENILLPYKSEIIPEISFTYFKCFYFQKLVEPEQTVTSFLENLFPLLKSKQKRLELQRFHTNHKHLNSVLINSFKHKIIVSTINSAKGLEGNDTYIIMNSNISRDNLRYVAYTRHRDNLFISSCT